MSGAERTGPVGTGQVRPLGLILAGGHASRLGGGDKTLLAVGGRTILERIVERLGPQCDGLVLSANGPPDRFPGWAGPVVPDHLDDAGKGPLAGLLAGLDWGAAMRPDLAVVLTVSADTPFLPRDLADRLAAARAAEADTIAFARSAGPDLPLVALWASRLPDPASPWAAPREPPPRSRCPPAARAGRRGLAGRSGRSLLQRQHASGAGPGRTPGPDVSAILVLRIRKISRLSFRSRACRSNPNSRTRCGISMAASGSVHSRISTAPGASRRSTFRARNTGWDI